MQTLEHTNQKRLFFSADELNIPDGWYIQSASYEYLPNVETDDVDKYLKAPRGTKEKILPSVKGVSVTIRKYEQVGHFGFINGVFVASP